MDGHGVTQKDLRALFDGKRGAVRQADIYTTSCLGHGAY